MKEEKSLKNRFIFQEFSSLFHLDFFIASVSEMGSRRYQVSLNDDWGLCVSCCFAKISLGCWKAS